MSREIMFRGWYIGPYENRMLEPNFNGPVNEIFNDPDNEGKVIYMQYTGLKDKHGTEIFEGDILAINNTRYVVGYREYSGGWQLEIKNEYCAEMVQGNCELLEIIGNVYEHKHLLEETA